MGKESKVILNEMLELVEAFKADAITWTEEGNKTAAMRARKATLAIEKLGKAFRKASVAEAKK
jgi:hypothetical protein